MVTSSYPMTADGREAAGSFVADLAEELARLMPVRVVAPGPEERIEGDRSGLCVYRYCAPDKPLSTLKPWHARDLASLVAVMKSGQQATELAISAGPVARLLALWALPGGHWARRTVARKGIPYSVWTLGSDIWSLGRIPVVRHQLARVLVEAETCYSDGLKLAEDTRRIAGRDVEFLPSTRRIESQRESPVRSIAPYRVLFLGRWHPNKGVDLLLEALGLLGEDDWSLIESVSICGGGPLEHEVRGEVERMRNSGRPVRLRGYLDKAEAETEIAAADYLLIPSRIESIPVVFSDAMKLECPVVAMPVGDLTALVSENGVGLLATNVTAAAYARALVMALRVSAAARIPHLQECARQFDLPSIARKLAATQDGRAKQGQAA